MDKTTLDYYSKNTDMLIERYDSVDMSSLHSKLKEYISSNDYVLDIGFGSGRELKYLKTLTENIYGIDPTDKFIENIKKDIFFKNKVFKGKLPKLDIPIDLKYNVITSIAVIMHLSKQYHKESLLSIKKYLKTNGYFIVSYSTEKREDERFFESMNHIEFSDLCKSVNLKEVYSSTNTDSLNRDIDWVIQIFQKTD